MCVVTPATAVNLGVRRPLPSPVPVRNPVTIFLLFLSKTDTRLVSACSYWAMATQAALGVFVAFTALLAFAAAYYTLTTLNVPASLVPWLAAGASIFVGALDREIAGSLDKMTAIVRPLLAFFLGLLTAIPLELYLFQGRVDQELERQYRQENRQQLDRLESMESQLDQRKAGLESELAELRKQDAAWGRAIDEELAGRTGLGRSGLSGAGPVYQNAKSQQDAVRRRAVEVRQDLDGLERALPEERRRIEGRFQREEVGKVSDFPTRYDMLTKVVHGSDSLYRLSWLLTVALILFQMTPAILKILTPHVDYHHLVTAEIRERVAQIDELSDRNYCLAIENPEIPRLSVAEKFTAARFEPVENAAPNGRRYGTKA